MEDLQKTYEDNIQRLRNARDIWFTPVGQFTSKREKWSKYYAVRDPAVMMVKVVLQAINPQASVDESSLVPWEKKRRT